MAEDITGNSPLVGYRPPWQGPEIAPGLLEHGMKLGDQAVNAFAVGVAANAKMRKAEHDMRALALRNQKLEQDSELDYAKFGLASQALQWRHDKDQEQIADWDRKSELKEREYQLERGWKEWKMEEKANQQEAVGNAYMVPAQVEAEGISPNDPNYLSEIEKRVAAYDKAPPAFLLGIKRVAAQKAQFARSSDTHALEEEEKNFYGDIGRQLYSGNYTIQDLSPIENPEKYRETVTEGGIGGSWFRIGGKKVPTDNIIIPKVTQPGGAVKDNVVSMKVVNDLKKRWEEIQAKRTKRLPPIVRPDLGVYPDEARNMQERAQRIINDPFATSEAKAAARILLEGNQAPQSAPTGYQFPPGGY